MYVHIAMSRDYVRGWALRDVWASGATLIVRVGVQRRLDLRCYWCGRVASCVVMLELNFHSGSSVYSSQWFACLASHTSRSDSPVAHPSSSSCRGNGCYNEAEGKRVEKEGRNVEGKIMSHVDRRAWNQSWQRAWGLDGAK
ncbi:hypothetical protein F2Q69_00022619 [Brassica cretica]|uniref:Uncharacterized protein n=1 Tax=Brassica cretica TaxID=69181 RepID=A0A8S9QDU1_BRACR|nr:hypothetical protein F2Q69_00022619 [Brassica cretica]